jgi:DNA repair protein RecO (recombination protein O)
MSSYSATGIVLSRTLLGDNDRIITIYTKEFGKVSAVAKGARKAGSRLSGATELFTSARLLMAKGRSLDVVSQCEITESFQALRHDLELMARATYLCELLDHTTVAHDHTACDRLYDLLMGALYLLQRAQTYPDAVVHAFELHLMAELGYAPVLEECVRCGEPIEAGSASISVIQGGVLCREHRYVVRDAELLTGEALSLLLQLRDEEPDAMLQLTPHARISAEIARMLRRYISVRLDRPLKSTAFLDEIRQTGG